MLNLNYNYFTDLNGVKGLNNMRKLTLVGGRLGGEEARKGDGRDVMAGLRGLQNLEELDLRMNPFTLSYYFPLLLPLSSPSSVIDPSTPTKKQSRSQQNESDVGSRTGSLVYIRHQIQEEPSRRMVLKTSCLSWTYNANL